MAGDPRAFAGDRVFRHLHHDLLTFAQKIGDGGFRALGLFNESEIVGRVVVVFLEILQNVGHVEKRVALQAEVDKGRLHAGENLRHATFVDVAHQRTQPGALHPQLDDLPFIEHCDARLVRRGVDDDLPRHGR